jgi:hypothetical protein
VLALAVAMLCIAAVSAGAHAARRTGSPCRAPRLKGLTLSLARKRAAHAGCTLRLKGATLKQAEVQTVARQSPAGGGHSSGVTVWLNPFCVGAAAYGPELREPVLTPGSTELVSGFYIVGGPLARFSDPGCKRPTPPPYAGTVEVTDSSGALVATQTSTRGHFAEIPLAAGSYTITGTFLDATINGGVHPKESQSVVIPPGHTVRQDFFLGVP